MPGDEAKMKRKSKSCIDRRRRLGSERLEDRWMLAGPHAPAAGVAGTTAIERGDPGLLAWASSVVGYLPGAEVGAEFQTAENALGPAEGTSEAAVSLGRGGEITLGFDAPIRDGLGYDFAVFENSFSDTFLELAFVEVSSDGVHFFRFENESLTTEPVDAFGSVDPTDVHNLAGKYRQSFGTPFDLEELRDVSPLLNTSSISHVRLVDIVGDGNARDSQDRPIYDPYPTVDSAGFDLDAIGVFHQSDVGLDVIGFEDVGASLASSSAFSGPTANGTFVTGPYDDLVVLGQFQSEQLEFNNAYSMDYESWSQWAYSNITNQVTPGYTNQFGVYAGAGANGSQTFGIGYVDQSEFFDRPVIRKSVQDVRRFSSLRVTNTTYAALSMRDGDMFAKKFGGTSGDDEDFFKLTILGKDDAGQTIGTVDHYLADYRFADNRLDYIVDQWMEVDLTPVAGATSLEFLLESSDTGDYGINTPAYFAVDDIILSTPAIYLDLADTVVSESDGVAATFARVSRANRDTSSEIVVDLDPVDATVASLPNQVTIPIGQPYVEFAIDTVDNDVFHGDQSLIIRATAEGMLGAQRELTIQEDEIRRLRFVFDASDLSEGNSVTATLTRNDGDLSTPLTVHVTSDQDALFVYDATVVFPSGSSSKLLTIQASEDDLDRPDTEVQFSVRADGYIDGLGAIVWLDNDLARIQLSVDETSWNESRGRPVSDFEGLGRTLAPQSQNNGSDGLGGFLSGDLSFNNDFDDQYGSWSGWAFSNMTDVATAGYGNQYSSWAGGGAADSDTYLIAAAFGYPALPSIQRDPNASTAFHSIQITNTTYAGLSMLQGDAFAKKFGGETGNDPDWLLLTIEGFDAAQQSIGTVDYYLADYRFDDNALDYIVNEWTEVSLAPLSEASELRFSMSSSDVGQWGMNTPAYFAADDVVLVGDQAAPLLSISRNTFGSHGDLTVDLVVANTGELRLPQQVLIPDGSPSISVPFEIIDDALVDGTQIVQVMGTADSFQSDTVDLSIVDNDLPALTLTFFVSELEESADQTVAVLHRNVQNVSTTLNASVLNNGDDRLEVPAVVSIPAGARSVAFTSSPIDNVIRDGDRLVSFQARVSGFASGVAQFLIVDDEQTGLIVDQSDDVTVIHELRGEDEIQVRLMAEPLSPVALAVHANSQGFEWAPSTLNFDSTNWNQPQSIVLRGKPDLLPETDEYDTLTISVLPEQSDGFFDSLDPVMIPVELQERDPKHLHITEDADGVFLLDEETGVQILEGTHADGIQVTGNGGGQTIQLGPLVLTDGFVKIDTLGGDDTILLRGGRFDFLDGGDGIDNLVLKLDVPVDFAAFLDQRVTNFEKYTLASDSGATLKITPANLEDLAAVDGSIQLRIETGQSLEFSAGSILAEPRILDDQFRQVIQTGDYQFLLSSDTPWHNQLKRWDVDGNGMVETLDALFVVNWMSRRPQAELPVIESLEDFDGHYYDVSADGFATAHDPLLVINELSRRQNAPEAESIVRTSRNASGTAIRSGHGLRFYGIGCDRSSRSAMEDESLDTESIDYVFMTPQLADSLLGGSSALNDACPAETASEINDVEPADGDVSEGGFADGALTLLGDPNGAGSDPM